MIIDAPAKRHFLQLWQLWQEAFGDTEEFLEAFRKTAFTPDRCRCVLESDRVAAALYWFDCTCRGKKLAYIYAVATAKIQRGKGLCAALMENTHAHLKAQGYSGAVLVPAEEGLQRYYSKFGYAICCNATTVECKAGEQPLPLQRVSPEAYASLRRSLLPEGSVLQEGVNLSFLASQADLFAARGLLLAASVQNDRLIAMEFLGDLALCPAIVRSRNCAHGSFRIPGGENPFAMYLPFDDAPPPTWFGLAFD